MNFYDPYYIIDPTIPHDGIARQGRTSGGKFTHNSILTTLESDNLPINSNGWASYARGAWNALERIVGADTYERIMDKIYPDTTIQNFSWRMICEMVEKAVEVAEIDKSNESNIVEAAHLHLSLEQFKVASKQLSSDIENEPHAVIQSSILDKFYDLYFHVMPEIPF